MSPLDGGNYGIVPLNETRLLESAWWRDDARHDNFGSSGYAHRAGPRGVPLPGPRRGSCLRRARVLNWNGMRIGLRIPPCRIADLARLGVTGVLLQHVGSYTLPHELISGLDGKLEAARAAR